MMVMAKDLLRINSSTQHHRLAERRTEGKLYFWIGNAETRNRKNIFDTFPVLLLSRDRVIVIATVDGFSRMYSPL